MRGCPLSGISLGRSTKDACLKLAHGGHNGLKLGDDFPDDHHIDRFTGSPVRSVAVVCAAQVLVQIGAFFWPALLPGMMEFWHLSNSQAGWITASFYGAYMVSVPVLVT
jgi:hypothetical protein